VHLARVGHDACLWGRDAGLIADMRRAPRIPAFRAWIDLLTAWLERRPAEMLDHLSAFSALKIQDDPEAAFI